LKKSHKESKISLGSTGVSDIDNLNELYNSEKLLWKKTCDKAFAIATDIINSHTAVKS